MDERLIEVAFPLKQTSLDSVHEKNVRHGHISTLHIWPARRPLAACRAALIATLLPDPGNAEERKELLERLGGRVVQHVKLKKLPGGRIEEQVTEETEGGILHWGRESSEDLNWFREKIRAAYGGRAPKVLDPFAGGGAIPLEAMRLGCEVTAVDINPVAWFILKCTLEYPQRLANQHRPLPAFACESYEFMESYFKARGFKDAALRVQLESLGLNGHKQSSSQPQLPAIQTHVASVEADLAWHVRAWGWWVLQKAKADLARFYPTVDGKPTVAYLWARTVTCKNCRATVPLLKTRWLCKKENKRVVLTMKPNEGKTGVVFGVQVDVPPGKGSAAVRREYDKQVGGGTMSRAGATCPCCGTIITKEDMQQEGLRGCLSAVMTAVVVEGPNGKEYRLPTSEEIQLAADTESEINNLFAQIPFGLPDESLTLDAKGNTWCVLYGVDTFQKLFTSRQLLALGCFVKYTRALRDVMKSEGYSAEWIEAVGANLACAISRLLDYCNCGVQWKLDATTINHFFVRFAVPISWDYAEGNTIGNSAGSYELCYQRICTALDTYSTWGIAAPASHLENVSAVTWCDNQIDTIVTDPPYYDSIGYAVIMDFFYVWLRRILYGLSTEIDTAFQQPLSLKWDHAHNDGELIDDSSRFGGDKAKSKAVYEDGMFRAFQTCHKSLSPDGRLVIVFAHKHPDAWETLVSAIIRAGFVVDGSWPIQTEMSNRTRALSSAALSSSVWLVCKKRPETARPGWDNQVLQEMQVKITQRLHDFWDAGIRGPDFVWAATGPALEAYSEHPIVKKSNESGKVLSVSEFLRHVRRMVVDFVVGRVLSHNGGTDAVSGLDDITTYYLLHRYDFGMDSAPIGPCILYAVSCGLSDAALTSRYDLLARTGGQTSVEEETVEGNAEEGEAEEEQEEGTSSTVKLKQWYQRKNPGMGYETLVGPPAPLIDQVHRLMHLWKAGDVTKVDDYLYTKGLGHNALFHQLLQALIELASAGSEERAMLESISNHVAARGAMPAYRLGLME